MTAAAFKGLALFSGKQRTRQALTDAAKRRSLSVLALPAAPAEVTVVAGPEVAWRLPVGMATVLLSRGIDLALSAPSADWFATLPATITGRTLTVTTAGILAAHATLAAPVNMVKLAEAKHPGFAATRVKGAQEAAELVAAADLPAETRLLLADRYLTCASEYRAFCVGRDVLTVSAYLVEDETWSPALHRHRASFHEQAAAWLTEVLRDLLPGEVPPACVLDVAKQENGDFVLLEANTTWGAGIYGCDPDAVLTAVLAAQRPTDARWLFTPGPSFEFGQ